MTTLITILILALVAIVAFWVIDKIGFPYPADLIVKCIIGVLILVSLLEKTGLYHF